MAPVLVGLMFLGEGHAMPLPQTATAPCELHIWGADKIFLADSKFAAPGAPKGTWHADRSIPIANINVFDEIQRLNSVPDKALTSLMSSPNVTIVRHSELQDHRMTKKAKRPLSPSSAACRADFILEIAYDFEYPEDGKGMPFTGVLINALAAKPGMHAIYEIREFDHAGKLVFSMKKRFATPLAIPRSRWAIDQDASIAAINQSIADGVEKFAKHLNERRTAN